MQRTMTRLSLSGRLAVALAAVTLCSMTAALAQAGQPTTCPPPCPTPAPPCGAGPAGHENKWQYNIMPYLWLPGLNGDVTAHGLTASVDASAGDIIDKLNWATMLHIEAQRNDFGFYVDPLYVKLSAGAAVDSTSASVGFRQWLVEFAATARLFGKDGDAATPSSSLLAILGGRYWNLKETITAADGRFASQTKSWVDPIIGLRYNYGGHPWSLVLQGDIGGFGVGSDFTWSIAPVLTYSVSDSGAIVAGWRALGLDYESGTGADLFKADVTYSGPILGYSLNF